MRSVLAMLFVATGAFLGGVIQAGEGVATNGVAGPRYEDLFDLSAARRPRPGEWLEYRVAVPVDPLENSLSPNPVPPPGFEPDDDGAGSGRIFVSPLSEPAVGWRITPVRLEIREVDESGCVAVVVAEGRRETAYLSAVPLEGAAAFHYDRGGGRNFIVRTGGVEYAVEEMRREGAGYGFIRWTCETVPFGMFRFATENVDVILVGRGDDARSAPEFPLRGIDRIEPSPGLLYSNRN